MAESAPPFHSFTFTQIENRRPRTSFRLARGDGGFFDLVVQRGSATHPISQFTRQVPLETALRLRDVLQGIGVFSWDESYGDASAPGSRRWSVSTVFEEGVFSVESRGGSDVPPGFHDMLEELYRLDFPRPDVASRRTSVPASASVGDAAAFMSNMNMPGADTSEMQRLLAQANNNPEALGRQVKEGFCRLSPAEQDQMLDALAATGLATREWWERFFRS